MVVRKKKWAAFLWALLALALCACGGEQDGETPPPEEEMGPFTLSVSLPGSIGDLDPLRSAGNETIMVHIYENLMRWEDGGDGWAVLAPGQAESYEMETDYAGNATYTFTLREGLCWSNGAPIAASDFVSSWQTLMDTEAGFPHRELLSCVAGYDEALQTGDASLLAVSAPDARTFVVELRGNPAYFLEEVCASVYTVPRAADGSFFNGPYIPAEVSAGHVVLGRNEKYYAPAGPDEIHFYTAGGAELEYRQLQEGGRDLITALPAEVLEELSAGGLWTPEPVTETSGVLLNTRTAPFDNENIRLAFHLAVDRQRVAEALDDLTARPAPGIVPYGVADYSERPVVETDTEEEDALPDPNAGPEPEKPAPTCWDFRSHSLEVVTAEHAHEYETDRGYAQALLANAGYPGGSGFPEVEYLYVKGSEDGKLAALLQEMWQASLGVTVKLRGVSQSEYDAALAALPEEENGEGAETAETAEAAAEEAEPVPAFQMAGQTFSPAFSDAENLLERWHSGSGENVTGYASDAFDILLSAARAAVSPDARDAYLHDAEAILLADSPVIPVLCRGGSFALAEGLAGLYRAPDGVFFLCGVQRGAEAG